MGHDIFNASSAATWLECSWSALNAVPEPPKKASTTAAADEGTRKHGVLLNDASIFFGDLPDDATDEDYENVQWVANYINQLEHGAIEFELRVKITNDCGGTADLFNPHPNIATILDAKFGKWDVPAFHNKQLLTYAAALLPRCNAEWWRLVIFQPNGLDDDDDPFKQWIAHRSEVEAHRARVMRAIADRSAPRPGPHCRWCKAFQACPAMASDAAFTIGAMSRRPEDLTTEELVRLLRLIRALGDVKPVYEDALTVQLKLGRAAEGATLKPSRTFRAWNDPLQAATHLYQHYGHKGVKALTPAAAEKLGLEGKKLAAIAAHKPQGELKANY
jgi:hypothetical protein